MITALLSLLAGALSVLAPCVLPFLPVIVGGSVGAGSRRRPYLIAAGLTVSLLTFTLLLKATTAFINIDPRVWQIGSGTLVVVLGFTMLFPGLWARVAGWLRLGEGSHALLDKAQSSGRGATVQALLIGASLGPVFSSCSPTYAWVIATVLPAEPAAAVIFLTFYCVGMAGTLLAVSLAGRTLVDRLGWAANPRGWFQRVIAVGFIVVGLLVATGVDKQVQAWAVDRYPGLAGIEQQLVPTDGDTRAELPRSSGGEITGISEWINSDPLTLRELRGKVVLVDFWTYSCINCIRTQPYLNAWYDRYQEQGLEIVGVHAPEFAFEKVPENVKRAVKDAKIRYPVALDNDFATWNAFHNRYWPAKYLFDKDGNLVWSHFGEGDYDEAEAQIRKLLHADGDSARPSGEILQHSAGQSPETYLGTARASGIVGDTLHSGPHEYQPADRLRPNEWTLGGTWKADDESITAQSDQATLTYRFAGKSMYLVMQGPPGSTVSVSVEGGAVPGGEDVVDGNVKVSDARLYKLVELPEFSDGQKVTLTFSKGVTANAFTFG